MLILNLKGGLGNQLFQLIAAYHFHELHNFKKMYIYYGNLPFYNKPRKYELKEFISKTPMKIEILNVNWLIFMNKIFLALLSKLNLLIVNENNFHDIKIIKGIKIIDGYFQSNEFMSFSSLNYIRRSMISSQNELKKIISSDLFNNTVGLHFRFTDRFSEKSFDNARNILSTFDFSNYDNVLLFSDDSEFCKNLLPFFTIPVTLVNQLNLNDKEEFFLISMMKNFIVPNSTFSIIARILSDNSYITFYREYDFLENSQNLTKLLKNNCNCIAF
jgi:hypothetical protein